MSQENVDIVRRVYDFLNRRDWEGVFRDAHPDFEMTTQRGPTAGTRRGQEVVQGFVEEYMGSFEDLIWEPEQFFDGGDQIVVFVKIRSRPRGGNVDMEVRIGNLWTIRDGAILSLKTYPVREEALEAAGLSE